jgi:hypothetical protein
MADTVQSSQVGNLCTISCNAGQTNLDHSHEFVEAPTTFDSEQPGEDSVDTQITLEGPSKDTGLQPIYLGMVMARDGGEGSGDFHNLQDLGLGLFNQ